MDDELALLVLIKNYPDQMKTNIFNSLKRIVFRPFDQQLSNNLTHQEKVQLELFRQAYWSFNFTVIMMLLNAVVILTGASFLLLGKIEEGTAMSLTGLTFYLFPAKACIRMTEKANNRLGNVE